MVSEFHFIHILKDLWKKFNIQESDAINFKLISFVNTHFIVLMFNPMFVHYLLCIISYIKTRIHHFASFLTSIYQSICLCYLEKTPCWAYQLCNFSLFIVLTSSIERWTTICFWNIQAFNRREKHPVQNDIEKER